MSRAGKKHPPKKKHHNKPRPAAVVPLSDHQRSIRAQEEFEKAMIHPISRPPPEPTGIVYSCG